MLENNLKFLKWLFSEEAPFYAFRMITIIFLTSFLSFYLLMISFFWPEHFYLEYEQNKRITTFEKQSLKLTSSYLKSEEKSSIRGGPYYIYKPLFCFSLGCYPYDPLNRGYVNNKEKAQAKINLYKSGSIIEAFIDPKNPKNGFISASENLLNSRKFIIWFPFYISLSSALFLTAICSIGLINKNKRRIVH